jgi:sterol desaturase/sphingolipid hydroxylase (fatty acid hydroxylase superfamily)
MHPPAPHSPLSAGIIVFGLNLVRYLLVAGAAFVLLHWLTPRRLQARRLGSGPVSLTQARRELLSSVLSIGIFALVGVGLYLLAQSGASRIYRDDRYGPVWFVLSVPVMLILHDTYFYWTHRLMHWKPLFQRVHLLHHRSHDPSPLAAFAFHPLEALIEAGIAPLIALTLPVHRTAFFLFFTVSMLINVWGHLGFELGPRGFMRSRLLAWLFNTTTHHHQHHQKTKWNYGLYFNVWDRLMGTNHPGYEAAYEAITEGARVEDAPSEQVAVL